MTLPRLYDAVLDRHLREERQMALVAGPRQVGKTTTCRTVRSNAAYVSWDDQGDRRLIAAGPGAVAEHLRLSELAEHKRVVIFDELHKYRSWKTFLKGLFDKHAEQLSILVSVDTVRRWLTTLTSLHHGFVVRPWYRNVKKSLRKEPKYFLRDCSGLADPGQRAETYVACHLFKAVQLWQDLGFGEFALCYLRDKRSTSWSFATANLGSSWR